MRPKILIVDDDDLVCLSLSKILSKLKYKTETCSDGFQAIQFVENTLPDIILLDIYLNNINGLDILKDLRTKYPHIPVIMITAYSDVSISVEAMKRGAYDFLLKPVSIDQLELILDKCSKHLQMKIKVEQLQALTSEGEITREYFGISKSIQGILSSVEKLANSEDTTILIQGESGTGKEVFAKYIHKISPRKDKVFISINCGTIPKELAESELFGYERGAFTGAINGTKLGKFELADGGTILLDEIGELSLDLQVKLLRVLQEKKFYRVGGEKEISVNTRIIAATNKNLQTEIETGQFREDLYYRLNVAPVVIPPLRERKEDIPILCYSFLKEFATKFKKDIKGINEETLEFLQEQFWKGNIRELRNAMERAILMMDEDFLQSHHFGFMQVNNKSTYGKEHSKYNLQIPDDGVSMDQVVRDLIVKTLHKTNGNQKQAAKMLGLSRAKFRYRVEQLNIEIIKSIN